MIVAAARSAAIPGGIQSYFAAQTQAVLNPAEAVPNPVWRIPNPVKAVPNSVKIVPIPIKAILTSIKGISTTPANLSLANGSTLRYLFVHAKLLARSTSARSL